MDRNTFFRLGVSVVLALCPALASAQSNKIVKVSDAIEGGQGGVSAARCGNTIGVGFGDAESSPQNSKAGYSVSRDGGTTFHDLGVLPVSSQQTDFGRDLLLGDASLACGAVDRFYYASSYFNSTEEPPCGGFPVCWAISLSTSTDGGKTWTLPVVVDQASSDNHSLRQPSISADPTNRRLYLAYVYANDTTPADAGNTCRGDSIYTIKLASSADGGKTWSLRQIEQSCDSNYDSPSASGRVQYPNVIVTGEGQVHVAYEFARPNGVTEIRVVRSLDHGTTFSQPVTVSTNAKSNSGPQLTVDRSGSSHRGTIYLTWAGSPSGTYTDALVSESTDSGVSFSFPRSIAPPPAAGAGRFQTNPVIAADNTGQVAACFYETPSNQPTNNSVYSYNCATSINYAATWQLLRVAASVPVGYDAIASDALLRTSGFFTSFEISTNGTRSVVGTNVGSH